MRSAVVLPCPIDGRVVIQPGTVGVYPGAGPGESTVTASCPACGIRITYYHVSETVAVVLVMAGARVVDEDGIDEGEVEMFAALLDTLSPATVMGELTDNP